ncbi:30S ribosome-binding factor RbfA [Methylomagnum sp.]
MPREFSRSDRVASQIQKEMAELVRVHVKDPELGMVTISDTEVTRDLAVAKLYVSFLAGTLPPNKAVKRLMEYVPELRHELAKRLRIRVLPEIRFVHDDSIERGFKMDALLHGLSQSAPDQGDGDEPNR